MNLDYTKFLKHSIIGPIEKRIQSIRIRPPSQKYAESELRSLPKYICYKAALLREKASLQFTLALVTGVSLVLFISSRIEISRLHTNLRQKEYILAPGVLDFTPVAPQTVPESHIRNTAMEFLQTFGNINPINIDEQYSRLSENMSPSLKIQFELEASSWRAKIKEEGISQILSITDKEIRADQHGFYQVTAIAKKDTFVRAEHIGSTDVVIEMVLELVPPKAGKRWFLQINKLESHEANAFRVKSTLSQPQQSSDRSSQ